MSMSSSSSSSNKGRDDVPDDVIIEIFSFLPVDSLLRFRFVSKSWFNLITSSIRNPVFVQMHTHHLHHPHYIATTTTDSFPTIFCTSTEPFPNHNLYSLNNINALSPSSSSSSSKNKEALIEIDYPFKDPSSRLKILGSCNGLLCIQVLYDYNNYGFTRTNNRVYTKGMLYLWNPSTKEFKMVPSTLLFQILEHNIKVVKVMYGFGYDRFTDDYKLVILLWFSTSFDDALKFNRSLVKVYSQRTNSWKREKVLDHKGMPRSILLDSPEKEMGLCLYVNGALHWISIYFNSALHHQISTDIYAFDIKDEEFRVVPQPAECSDRFMFGAELQVLRGCLCIFSCYTDTHNESRFEMWMMRDYGVKESWTKLFIAIEPKLMMKSLKPLWFWRNGEVLIGNGAVDLSLEHLVIYDPNNNKVIESMDSQGISFNWENAIVHIGSFESLKSKSENRKRSYTSPSNVKSGMLTNLLCSQHISIFGVFLAFLSWFVD